MANFHPRSHQNADGQLNQSLEQFKQALAASSDLPADPALPKAQPEANEGFDWEAALESAAADIDNYLKDECQ
jgi:hypothetical protein